MPGVNRVTILGRLGQDPEVRTFDDGGKVAFFSVATSEKWKDKSGELKESTEWHRIVLRNGKQDLADLAEKYLKKGEQVYIEGKLKTRSYEQDGITKYTTEIIGFSVTLLGGSRDNQSTEHPSAASLAETPDGEADDLPF